LQTLALPLGYAAIHLNLIAGASRVRNLDPTYLGPYGRVREPPYP